MTSQLVGSDFTDGAQLPQYANGRVLTARDLATGQATLWDRDALAGQAAGHGVVTGLWVTASGSSLTIAPGLAVSPSGQPVPLASAITLPLVASISVQAVPAAGFTTCATPANGVTPSITAGEYLLTVRPTSQQQGQAPLASTPGSSTPAGCTAQWTVQGVSFNVITLQPPSAVAGVTMTTHNRRNLLAHWFFGAARLPQLGADPFAFSPAYGGLDSLDPVDLTSRDVPLAVFSWDGQSVSGLDNWSVRRRITAPDPVSTDPMGAPWSAVVSDRRGADAQARFLQFQDQVMDLVARGTAGTTVAADVFGLLPPAGFLPVGLAEVTELIGRLVAAGNNPGQASSSDLAMLEALTAGDLTRITQLDQLLSAAAPRPGFSLATFFGGLARGGGLITWELADLLVQQSWRRDPVPTPPAAQPAGGGIPLTYYYVLENLLAAGQLLTSPSSAIPSAGPAFYVVFAKNYDVVTGTVPPVVYTEPFVASTTVTTTVTVTVGTTGTAGTAGGATTGTAGTTGTAVGLVRGRDPLMPAARGYGVLAGQVADGHGAPLRGLQVYLTGSDGSEHQASTAASGQYSFANLDKGEYTLVAGDQRRNVTIGAECSPLRPERADLTGVGRAPDLHTGPAWEFQDHEGRQAHNDGRSELRAAEAVP